MTEIFGSINVETPKYESILKKNKFEIRKYPSMIMASAAGTGGMMDSNQFRTVAGYIFGSNHKSQKVAMTAPVITEPVGQKIDMTAPVITQQGDQGTIMSFVLPSQFKSAEELPIPNDPRVKIHQVPPQTVAVYTSNGFWSESNLITLERELKEALQQVGGWKVVGNPKVYRYNPPWTLPMFRTTELVLPIEPLEE